MLRVAVVFAVVAIVTAGGGEVENKKDEEAADNKRKFILCEISILMKTQLLWTIHFP